MKMWQSLITWFPKSWGLLATALLLTACEQQQLIETQIVVVTEVAVVAGEPQVITRLVQETAVVTATPPPSIAVPQTVELDLAYLGQFPDIDPQQGDGNNAAHLMENLFVGLTNFNHQAQQVEPELAQSWEVDATGRVWTFHLRNDIYWVKALPSNSDSSNAVSVERVRPVVAGDVVTAVRRACSQDPNTPDAFVLFIIQGCEQLNRALDANIDPSIVGVYALDDDTLQVNLTVPVGYFLTLTTLPLFMPVPTELVEQFGSDWRDQFGQFAGGWQTAVNLITSGPFFPTPRDAYGQRVTLHRNPEWPIRRLGNVDRVNILFMDDENDIFQAWQAKSLDISLLPIAQEATMLEQAPQRMTLVPNQTVFYLSFNFDSEVFRDPAARQAFAAAIDRERLVEAVFGSTGALPMRHLTPPGVLGAPPIDQVGGSYSPDFARLKMAESSFGGCRNIPLITLMVSSADLSLLQAELIRGMWVDELGCPEEQIVIEQVQFGTLLANTRRDAGAARPDIWELGWSSYYPDAHNWLNDLLHCQHSENRQNRPCGPIDEAIVQASTLSLLPDRAALYRNIENEFFDGGGIIPIIPLYVRGDVEVVQNWVRYTPATFGGEQFDTYMIDADTKRLERSR